MTPKPNLLSIIFLLVFSVFPQVGSSSLDSRASGGSNLVNPIFPYDRQIGLTFTQNFTSLSFNITAVTQVGPDGIGPAYLLNGLTDRGYWYQVGLSWNWPYLSGPGYNPGFRGFYEVFEPTGDSIFPPAGGSGWLDVTVNEGDTVLLSLYFSVGNVVMLVQDWSTGSTAWTRYPAAGATRFVGLKDRYSNTNGFFTGLMTEQYYSAPYYGRAEKVVFESDFALASAWMWIDEYNGTPHNLLFFNGTSAPIVYHEDQDKFHYFSSNGVGSASNAFRFITGLADVGRPEHSVTPMNPPLQGSTLTLVLNFSNYGIVSMNITEVKATTSFGTFYSSEPWFDLSTGDTKPVQLQLMLPIWIPGGNYTFLISTTWRFYSAETSSWAVSQTETRSTLVIPEPTITTWASWLVRQPVLWTLAASTLIVAIALIRRQRSKTLKPQPNQQPYGPTPSSPANSPPA